MGVLKSPTDLRSLKEAGKITSAVLAALKDACQSGISITTLEKLANQLLAKYRSSAPFKSFEGFNHAVCVSINEEIVNGSPSRDKTLKEGDLVSIATASEYRNIYAKAARTFCVGNAPHHDAKRLLTGTASVIESAIEKSRVVKTLNELLQVIPEIAQNHDLRVITGLGGSGIGKHLHDWPVVPNHPTDLEEEISLTPGLCFTLMPMFTLGNSAMKLAEDGWTYVTEDGSLSAHFADTLLMTENGLENMTAN